MLKTESYKKGIVVSTILNVFGKGIGFLNTLIIAFYFGASSGTDIYFYILSVAVLITSTINGIDYLVIIPQSMKLREQINENESQKFVNFFVYSYVFIGVIIAFAGITFPVFLYTLFSKYDFSILKNNYSLLYLGSLIIMFQLINNLLSAVLTSYRFFTASIFSGLVNSVFSILFTVFFHHSLGITGTLLGITFGYIINFSLLIYFLKHYQKWDFKAVSFMKDKIVWKNIGLMQINILPVWVRSYFTLYFLTGMGVGIITSLNLAQMLSSLPEIFILTQISSIVGIKFSELAARKDIQMTNILLTQVIKSLFLLIIPIALIMAIANKEIIQLVFQRGNMQQTSISITRFCFFYFALLLPSKVLDVLFSRLFTSYQIYGISTLFAFIAHSIITVILYLLTTHFQLKGYFFTLLIGYYIVMPITFLMILKYKLSQIKTRLLIKETLILFTIGGAVYLIAAFIFDLMIINNIVKILLLGFMVGTLFILLANWFLDLKEQKNIIKNLFSKQLNSNRS